MRKKISLILLSFALLTWLLFCGAAFGETIGWVTGFEGESLVQRPDVGTVQVSQGIGVESADTLVTGPSGKMKILFVDNTILSLGSATTVLLADYEFALGSQTRRSWFQLIKGKVRVLVGKVFGVETSVKVESPTAVAGVTGTTFIVHYDESENITHILSVSGVVGVSSSSSKRPGLFQISDGEITHVKKDALPSPPKRAGDALVQQYLDDTRVDDITDLSKMPGRPENIIDNPLAGDDKSGRPGLLSPSLAAQSEGEGGAEFDAYNFPEVYEGLADTDLPLPGDLSPTVGGLEVPTNPDDNPASVNVTVTFEDGPSDAEKKKK